MSMCIFLIYFLALAASRHVSFAQEEEIIRIVNNAHTTWKAGRNFPTGTSKASLERLLGAELREGESLGKRLQEDDRVDVPAAFDAREHWPNCKSISFIRDQGACGSAWAVAAAAALSDRFCIATNGKFNELLSSREVISCCKYCYSKDGCQGGYHIFAWQFLEEHGIVTGGEYGSKEGCQPYTFKQCNHSGNALSPCSKEPPSAPKCAKRCTNPSYQTPFKKDHHKANSSYSVESDENAIKNEIFKRGPVQAVHLVYEDYYYYKSGVYQHVSGEFVGYHAVRLLGWGEENGVPYWLADNSWNEGWGEKGFIKFKRGDCNIEANVYAGSPSLK